MCEGVDCSDKEHCSRHTANINEINQSWSHAFQDKKPTHKKLDNSKIRTLSVI